ncbi:MAG: methyltransferase, partial [Candidatus Puniceispirillaceae bacterium]
MDELMVSQTVKRRSGGRLARQQERSRPLAADVKPVRPGLIGGRYQPLAPEQVAAISDTVFQIL